MKKLKRLLKETAGYTLAELLLVIAIFAIGIVPIYQIVISTGKVQKSAEETYEATLQAQALLQNIRKQIDTDVKNEYDASRGKAVLDEKDWMKLSPTSGVYSVFDFLGIDQASNPDGFKGFNKKFNTEHLLYEVYIWKMVGGKPTDPIALFSTEDPKNHPFKAKFVDPINPADLSVFTKIEIEAAVEECFSQKESIMWTESGSGKLVAIGEITGGDLDEIKIRANGIKGDSAAIDSINSYKSLEDRTKLTYTKETDTHRLVIEDNKPSSLLEENEIIQLSIDLTRFKAGTARKIIRIENKTKATVVLPVYDENNPGGIKIYPIQEHDEGNIIVESRNKLEPSKNFVIGIIVRDFYNSTFGDENKILSKIVDVYSFDYNK